RQHREHDHDEQPVAEDQLLESLGYLGIRPFDVVRAGHQEPAGSIRRGLTPPSPATTTVPAGPGSSEDNPLRSSCCVSRKVSPPSPDTSMTPARPLMITRRSLMATPSVSIAVVCESSCAQVSPASADLYRFPRSPKASSPSPRIGTRPKKLPSYGEGSARQLAPRSSE